MNEAQISLAGKISGALKRLIASKLGSQYKGEAPYSGCLVQEGYFDIERGSFVFSPQRNATFGAVKLNKRYS